MLRSFENSLSFDSRLPKLLSCRWTETKDVEMLPSDCIEDTRPVVGDIQDHMIEGNKTLANPSYPQSDINPIFFNLTIENGTCVRLVFSALRVVNDSICTISSSNLSIFEQPERMSTLKDFDFITGRFRRHIQSFKFKIRRLGRFPMEWCSSDKFGQSLRMTLSRFGSFEKSGVFDNNLE